MRMPNSREKRVLFYILSHELDISKRPFLKIARALDLEERNIINILVKLQKEKAVDKLRLVLNHVKAGYKENALICWHIRKKAIGAVTNLFIENKLISHCCERTPQKEFNYNIFTVMHAKNKKDIRIFVRNTARAFRSDCAILFTEKELKKEKLTLQILAPKTIKAQRQYCPKHPSRKNQLSQGQ